MIRFARGLAGLLAAGLLMAAGPALAHPHVFVDAKAEMVFDASGKIAAVRNIWQFDKAFTAFAVQGLDKNNDGKLSDDELKPLAKTNVESLKEYHYFTFLKAQGRVIDLDVPKEYWLQFVNGRLTLFFTLPLKVPVAAGTMANLSIYDPEYFVAINFVTPVSLHMEGAPAACKAAFQPPSKLDSAQQALLSAIPADQRDLPAELGRYALGLANIFRVSCP